MADVLPSSAPARRRTAPELPDRRWLLAVPLVVALGAGGVVATRSDEGAAPVAVAAVDAQEVPGPDQAPLTESYAGRDPATGARFVLQLPAGQRLPAGESGSLLSARLGSGPDFAALFFLRMDDESSARSAIDAVGAGAVGDTRLPVGPVRASAVGPYPAWVREGTLVSSAIREFRLEHDGTVYGFGILHRGTADPTGLNTGLAALRTFRWS